MNAPAILIVEDERIVARDIQNRLTHLGYSVVGVTRFGAEAIRLADEVRPDLVLMDIRLEGDMDGVTAAREIRDRWQLPIVYLTAYADDETLARARVTEPFGYILKPFAERELRTAIEMALYKHQAERRLRESERRYAVTLSSIGDAVIATDDQSRVGFLNPVAAELTGWAAHEAIGRPLDEVFRIINEQTRQPVENPVARILREGKVVALANHTTLQNRNGREIPIEDCGAPIRDDKGVITGSVLVFQDVSERRRSEQSLTLFRSLIDRSSDAIEVVDPSTGRILDVNEQACHVHGYTRAEYLTLRVPDLDPTMQEPGAWEKTVEEVRQSGALIHRGQHRRKDGSAFPIEVNLAYVRLSRDYLLAVGRDTTERQRAEQALRESQERLRLAVQATNLGPWDWDLRSGDVEFSPEWLRQLGYQPGEIPGRYGEWETRLHPDDRERVLSVLRAYLDGRQTAYADEYRLRHRDGSYRWIYTSASALCDPSGKPYRMLGCHLDVTERKRSEQALRESYALLQAVVEGTSDAVFVKDLTGCYLMINSAGARFLGKSVGEVIGKLDQDVLLPHTWQVVRERELQVMATGQEQTFEQTATVAGITRTYLSTKSAFRDGQGHVIGIVGIARDVTELKRLEEQFRQAQKMEAVGRLAGGVAHDFNNLLTVINGYSELVCSKLSARDPNRELLAEVQRAGERAAKLTRQLLAFSRKQVLQPRNVSLNDLLRELHKLLNRLIGEDIELDLVLDPELGLARIDPGQFEQAVINLAVNARDAMPRGGRLTLETRNAELDEVYAEQHAEVRSGPYVLLIIRDTGHGMDAATKALIFEPFFTTKEVGKGTGLGLAMVYGFVKQSGGQIEVDSETGGGTTFKVYLPRTEATVPSPKSSPSLLKIPKGTETVLLVEDEDAVRTLSRIILQSSGYTVLEARDGSDGVRVAQQHAGPIHLLVADLVMPRMSGRHLAEVLVETRPTMRVLFLTGYSDEEVVQRGVSERRTALLQKPFTPMGLARKAREVLDATEAQG
jgi:PAS domain S-box-containing protein